MLGSRDFFFFTPHVCKYAPKSALQIVPAFTYIFFFFIFFLNKILIPLDWGQEQRFSLWNCSQCILTTQNWLRMLLATLSCRWYHLHDFHFLDEICAPLLWFAGQQPGMLIWPFLCSKKCHLHTVRKSHTTNNNFLLCEVKQQYWHWGLDLLWRSFYHH